MLGGGGAKEITNANNNIIFGPTSYRWRFADFESKCGAEEMREEEKEVVD